MDMTDESEVTQDVLLNVMRQFRKNMYSLNLLHVLDHNHINELNLPK